MFKLHNSKLSKKKDNRRQVNIKKNRISEMFRWAYIENNEKQRVEVLITIVHHQ